MLINRTANLRDICVKCECSKCCKHVNFKCRNYSASIFIILYHIYLFLCTNSTLFQKFDIKIQNKFYKYIYCKLVQNVKYGKINS